MSDWSPPSAPPARQDEVHNPYAPPAAQLAVDAEVPENAEAIRREHLSVEANLRSIGTLYGAGAVLLGLATITAFAIAVLGLVNGTDTTGSLVLLGGSVLYGLITWANVVLAKGLRALDPKVRMLATIFAVIGLLGFPIGTLISLYILFLLYSAKGKRVMTSEYQAIVAQTPHIRYKTPLWLLLLVGALVASILVAAFLAAG